MNPSNFRKSKRDIRCIRQEIVNGEVKDFPVYINPDVVRNEYLFKATGLILADPLLDEKMNPVVENGEEEVEMILPHSVTPPTIDISNPIPLAPEFEPLPALTGDNSGIEKISTPPNPEQTAKIEKLIQQDDGKPKNKGGRPRKIK